MRRKGARKQFDAVLHDKSVRCLKTDAGDLRIATWASSLYETVCFDGVSVSYDHWLFAFAAIG